MTWYIVWSVEAQTHVLSHVPPEGNGIVQESLFPIGYPAGLAIQAIASTMLLAARATPEQKAGVAFKITLVTP